MFDSFDSDASIRAPTHKADKPCSRSLHAALFIPLVHSHCPSITTSHDHCLSHFSTPSALVFKFEQSAQPQLQQPTFFALELHFHRNASSIDDHHARKGAAWS